MTLPDERYRSVLQTKQFLQDLLNPAETPGVPRSIRQRAAGCLRHYPDKCHMDMAGTVVTSVFQTNDPVDPLTKMLLGYDANKQQEETNV